MEARRRCEERKEQWRRLLFGVVCAGSVLAASGAARAQAPPDSSKVARRRYTFAFRGVPLARALEYVIDETRLSLVYTSQRVAGRQAYCRAERLGAEALLGCVLRGTGLDYARLSSGTYVLLSDPRAPPRYGHLAGQVVDAATGIPLGGANVLLAAGRGGTSTNAAGRFFFSRLPPGPHRLLVTHVAYHGAADTVEVRPRGATQVSVALQPRAVLIAPVVVSGLAARLPSAALGAEQRAAAGRSPLAGAGTADVVRGLEGTSGVRLTERNAGLHIQGGAAGEQQFRLGGAPVFTPVALGGLIGPFSPLAVGRIDVQKAGFGARRGSHLSGVIDAHYQMPAKDTPALTVRATPLSLDARAEGRTHGGERTTAWMVAARRSLWGLYQPARLESLFRRWGTPDGVLLRALEARGNEAPRSEAPRNEARGDEARGDEARARVPASGPLDLGFSDLHAAAHFRLDGLRGARLSFYRGSGAFGIEGAQPAASGVPVEREVQDGYHWTSYAGHLSYEWVPSERLFAQAEAWGTSYALDHAFEAPATHERLDAGATGDTGEASDENARSGETVADNFDKIREVGLRLTGDYVWTERHHLSGALAAALTGSDFAISLRPAAPPSGPAALRPIAGRVAGFLEDEVALGTRWRMTPGARLTYVPQQHAVYAEPRLALRYDRRARRQGASWGARAAVGRYRQYRSSYDVATAGAAALLPRVRFWLPIGRAQRPPEAYHATLAALYRPAPPWSLSAEAYYKGEPHLLALAYGQGAEATGLFTPASGYAYGGVLKAERSTGRVQGKAYYEYAVARRRIQGRFGGGLLPVPWSAPHRLHLQLDAALTSHLTATVRWKGLFGRSWGFRQAYYDLLTPAPRRQRFPPYDLSRPAAHRLPPFSQWDVSVAYARDVGSVTLHGQAALVNALGRRNVTNWSLRYDEAAGTYARVPRYAVPRYPSLSLQVRW